MTRKSAKSLSVFTPVLVIVVSYVLLGAAWLLFSDRLLFSVIDDPTMLLEISAAKGELLAEFNYRVKCNLQIIASILSLEAEGIIGLEACELNHRMRARIRTMGIALKYMFEEGESGRA